MTYDVCVDNAIDHMGECPKYCILGESSDLSKFQYPDAGNPSRRNVLILLIFLLLLLLLFLWYDSMHPPPV